MSKQTYEVTIKIDGDIKQLGQNMKTVIDTVEKLVILADKYSQPITSSFSGVGYECGLKSKLKPI